MFNSITWESFLYASTLLIGGYYVVTTLLLYHQEIIAWFKPKPFALTTTAPLPEEPTAEQHEPVMGSVRVEDEWQHKRTALIDSAEVLIAEDTTGEMPDTVATPGQTDLLNGSVADLMQEINTLLEMAAEYNSSKEEVAPLFAAVFERYTHLKNTAYAQAINRHVCEEGKTKFAFDLQPIEVRAWWETSLNS